MWILMLSKAPYSRPPFFICYPVHFNPVPSFTDDTAPHRPLSYHALHMQIPTSVVTVMSSVYSYLPILNASLMDVPVTTLISMLLRFCFSLTSLIHSPSLVWFNRSTLHKSYLSWPIYNSFVTLSFFYISASFSYCGKSWFCSPHKTFFTPAYRLLHKPQIRSTLK